MRRLGFLAILGIIASGCAAGGPSDSDQQKMAQEFSPEKVADAYEKAGKHAEAEEVRRNSRKTTSEADF